MGRKREWESARSGVGLTAGRHFRVPSAGVRDSKRGSEPCVFKGDQQAAGKWWWSIPHRLKVPQGEEVEL